MTHHINEGVPGGVIGFISAMFVNIFGVFNVEIGELLNTIFLAGVGSFVGFFVHLFLKYIIDKFKGKKDAD